MSKPPARPANETVAARFRREIEAADGEGLARTDLRLRLTLSDVSRLQRDPTVAVADISFAGGGMRYLGVLIEQGGVAKSDLYRPASA